jgi:hypothetical protein
MSEKTKTTKSVSEHIRHLYTRLGEVESRLRKIETRNGASGTAIPGLESGTLPVDAEILAQVVELEHRLKQLEAENRALTQMCSKLQEHNDAISNLYVAKHRLHASLDATEIMRIVRDILVELVGAKEFGIYLLDPRAQVLRRVTGGGAKTIPESVPLGEGHLGRSGGTGKPFYFEAAGATVRAPETPLAVIPLRSSSDTIGVIAIWNLLPHKVTFTPVDHQLLELVAEHAPAALKSAHLHHKNRGKAQR